MVLRLGFRIASEKRSLEDCLKGYPAQKRDARNLVSKIALVLKLESSDLRILEVGAAQGSFVIACNELGYSCEGVEPSDYAISVSKDLAKALNVKACIKKGYAEEMPYDDGTFDIVMALSVIEHVENVEKAFSEAFRVLKPRGAFYFWTASSLCPHQYEIRFVPFFGWYPDSIKAKIMRWASRHRPSWVGYTETPAINWFTPWKANRLLRDAGFKDVRDRWDLAPLGKPGFLKTAVCNVIRSTQITRLVADVLNPSCGYLAIKGKAPD